MAESIDRLEAAFAREEARAQASAAPVLLAAVVVITAWLTYENGFPTVLVYYPLTLGIAALSISGALLRRLGWQPWWERYARFGAAVLLVVAGAMAQNPYLDPVVSPPMRLRWQNDLYMFVIIAAATFTYSARVVLWTGAVASTAWLAAGLIVLADTDTTSELPPPAIWREMSVEARQRALMDPRLLFTNGLVRSTLLPLVVAVILAAFVHRSRGLVRRHADAERQRDNLSRYFSANLVDDLAESDDSISATRRLDASVLFADIVGFTTMSADLEPEQVIEILRQFHRRTADAVFANAGTLDKYIGDEVLATFGTPRPGPADATNALRCAAALLASVEHWNRDRRAAGAAPIRIGIGVHHGPVVLGNIGDDRRLEFAVVGDTVNLASRLERLTRDLDCRLIASGELIDAARREGCAPEALLPDLREIPGRPVRGRDRPVRLFALPQRTDPTQGSA